MSSVTARHCLKRKKDHSRQRLSSIEFYVCLMHAVECCTYLCRLSCLSQKCFICLGILFYQWVQVGWTWLSSTCCHLRWMPLSWMAFLSLEAVPCCSTCHTGWGYQSQSDCIFLDLRCHLPACALCAAKALNQWGGAASPLIQRFRHVRRGVSINTSANHHTELSLSCFG